MQVAEDLFTDGKDTEKGRHHPTGLGGVIKCGGTGGYTIWVGDVGSDPPHGKGPGEFPGQGRLADYKEAEKAMGIYWSWGYPTLEKEV